MSGYSGECALQGPCDSLAPRQTTVREHLQNKKDALTEQLSDVNAAIDALDANPAVSKVLELLARAGARM